MKHRQQRSITCRRASRGFTLIEGMVATAVFAVAITGTVSMVNSCWGTLRQTQEEVYVNHVLESVVESARDLGYPALRDSMHKSTETGLPLPTYSYFTISPTGVILGQYPNPNIKVTEFERDLDSASGTILLQQVRPGLLRLSVSVTWRPAFSTRRETLETVTLVTREGVTRT
jgi:prepilin-type N-terminal cleavage/methylation domain-containing protein